MAAATITILAVLYYTVVVVVVVVVVVRQGAIANVPFPVQVFFLPSHRVDRHKGKVQLSGRCMHTNNEQCTRSLHLMTELRFCDFVAHYE